MSGAFLTAKLALAVAVIAALLLPALLDTPKAAAQGAREDFIPPEPIDISVTLEYFEDGREWRLLVKNDSSDVWVYDVKVRIDTGPSLVPTITHFPTPGSAPEFGWSFSDGILTLAAINPGRGSRFRLRADISGTFTGFFPIRVSIISSTPMETPGSENNSRVETWASAIAGATGLSFTDFTSIVVLTSVDNRRPPLDGETAFKVSAKNPAGLPHGTDRGNNNKVDTQVKITITEGLSFAWTNVPDGITISGNSAIWSAGDLPASVDSTRTKTLSVPVSLSGSTPLETRCLTAEVQQVTPPDPEDRRFDDVGTVCLGEPPVEVLGAWPQIKVYGNIGLFTFFPCIGATAYPCNTNDTLELVVRFGLGASYITTKQRRDDAATPPESTSRGIMYLQPESVVVHVDDRIGRTVKDGGVIWSTGALMNLTDTQQLLTSSWQINEAVTVTAPGGGDAPGRWVLTNTEDGHSSYDLLNAPDSTRVTYDLFPLTDLGSSPNEYFEDVKVDFGEMGTYVALFEIKGVLSMTTYTDSGTYTFHVGPMADLEVRDAGPNPAVAGNRRAYTIEAVNHGPSDAAVVEVALTGVPDGASVVASQGSYDPGTGIWRIGELENMELRTLIGKSNAETLTIIAEDAGLAPITATIASKELYTVCLDGNAADVAASDESACTGGSNTWHTAEYYDPIAANNTATIAAQTGTGAGHPDAPTNLRVVETPVGNIVEWDSVAEVNGFPVTHYQVQRSASPWEILSDNQKGTVYADMGDGAANASYRVRAVNRFDVPGPWSQQATPHLKPSRPKSFTAAGQSDTVAELSWGAPDTVADVTVSGYDLEFSEDGGATWTSLATPATLGQSATSYTHTDATLTSASLTPDILRQYRVRTVGTVDGSTVKSDWATATLTHPKPGVPKTFAAAGQSETQASLSWSAPDAVTHVSVTGYEVEFSKDGGANWATVTGTPTLDGTTWSLPHSDSGLAADAVRQYRARTLGTVGSVTVQSDWAYALASEDYPAPGAPRNFAARAINRSRVDLSWIAPVAVSGVTLTGYHLEFSSDGNTWTRLEDDQSRTVLPATATYHPHTNDMLEPGALRQYRLRAVGTANNASFESGWVFASAATEAVGPPQNLAAVPDPESPTASRTRINLTWDVPAFGQNLVTGYRIDYAPDGSEDWQTLEHSYRTNPRSYQHTGRLPGERSCYRVAAIFAGGTGPFTASVCATTLGNPTDDLPGEPENLRIDSVGSNYVVLEWDAPSSGGAVEYYQWRSNIHTPTEVSRAATSVRVGGLQSGTTYEFQVRAGNSNGPGGWSTSVPVMLHRASGAVKASPAELEVEKGGSGSFNVRLNRSPKWPMRVYFIWEGADCLTESLPYQQGQILLPTNPSPSKEFWDDIWWGPPEDRFAAPWNTGLDIQMDASGCQGGETAVIDYDLWTLPFSELEGLSLWEVLNLNEDEWRDKWGVDPLDGISGPSVKVTVVDGAGASRATAGEQTLADVIAGGASLNVSAVLPPQAAVWRREEWGLYGFPPASYWWDWWD